MRTEGALCREQWLIQVTCQWLLHKAPYRQGNGSASERDQPPAAPLPCPLLSSHFSLEPLVSKHQAGRVGKAVPFVTGFRVAACTRMAARMAEFGTAAAGCVWVMVLSKWAEAPRHPLLLHPGTWGGVGAASSSFCCPCSGPPRRERKREMY